MVENNIKSAIILEDDAIVSQHFKEIVEDTLNKINKNHELIFLITEKLNPISLRNGLWKDIDLHITRHLQKFKRCIIYATAYLITLSGAKNYLTTLIQ